jgi:hypothetical protein
VRLRYCPDSWGWPATRLSEHSPEAMRPRVLSALLAALCLGLRGPREIAVAQEPLPATHRVDCGDCVVALRHVVSLTQPSRSVQFGALTQVKRNSRGEYIVGPSRDLRSLAVFSASGELLRVISGNSLGTQAWRLIETVAVSARDSVWVFDALSGRGTVLSPQYEYVRTVAFPGRVHEAEVLADGRLVTHSIVRTPELYGYLIHLFTSDGRAIRSFSQVNSHISPAREQILYRLLVQARDRIATIPRIGTCILESWTMRGDRADEIGCTQLGDLGLGGAGRGEDTERPPTEIRALVPESDSRLWIVATVARRDWRPTAHDSLPRHRSTVDRARLGEFVDTKFVEVSLREHRVLSVSRLAGAYVGSAGPGQVISQRRATGDSQLIDVWQVAPRRP